MKFNRSEIMKNAWALVKEDHISISIALKAAWALAKAMIEADAVCADCESNYAYIRPEEWETIEFINSERCYRTRAR